MGDVNFGLEALGLCAGIVIFASYVCKDMIKLRVINLAGTVLWLVYGAFQGLLSLIILNIAAGLFHIYHIVKYKKEIQEKNQKNY